MTVSVLKMHFRKLLPKIISYRDYKSFENERFMDALILALNSRKIDYTKNPDVFFARMSLTIMLQEKENTSVGLINLS